MITTLKKLFAKKKPIEDSFDFVQEVNDNPNFVTEPAKILQILKAIESDSGFCTIELNNSDQIYNSHIIDVQEHKKIIILDELIPNSGNQLLQQSKQLKLTTYLNNIHLSIALTDLTAGHAQGMGYYKASFPHRIYYPQRRKSPRINLTTHKMIFQGTSKRTNFSVGGTVIDISRHGIGIIVDNAIARIQRGDQLNRCVLTLPDHSKIHFDLVVRFSKPYSNSRTKLIIGGHYSEIKSNKEQKQLEQFFAFAERSEIRKQKDT
ncbi:MAG: flagellar brake protein [Methyloprofundus sp.]|nr:flagellar brake protein [Methyloprofundus sp.]